MSTNNFKYLLKLEAIGHGNAVAINKLKGMTLLLSHGSMAPLWDGVKNRRQWVAKISGNDDQYKYKREFLKCDYDYEKSNSKGTRGVYAIYILSPLNIYEVNELISWKNNCRYFCHVVDGNLIEIAEEEVLKWVKNYSE